MDINPLWEERFPFLNLDILQSRLSWSIRLRWLAAGGFFLATLVAKYVFDLILPFEKIWAVLGILISVNILYFVVLKLFKEFTFVTELVFLHIQIIIDLLLLTIIVHLSGGIENPIYLFFVFHVVISSIIFPGLSPVIIATLVIILFSLLVYFEYAGIIVHYSVFNTNIHNNEILIYLILAVFTITVYFSTYICTTFMFIYRSIKIKIDQQNRQLIEIDRQKTQFFQYASHELKSPIIAIKTSLDGFLKNYAESLDSRAYNLLERASKRAGQMLDIIRELLALSKNKNIIPDNKIEKVKIQEIIKEIVEQENIQTTSKKIKIELNLLKTRILIDGIKSDFEKVFENLISNAIRYTKDKGEIIISETLENESYVFQIKDTGIGIPEKDLQNIFAEFYRSENAKKLENFGTGLGLSLVKQIIEKYNGTVQVKSKINKGTTFIIHLPLSIGAFKIKE